jgi:hypothetical protein
MPLRKAFYVINIGYIISPKNQLSDLGNPLDFFAGSFSQSLASVGQSLAKYSRFANVGTPKVAPFSTPPNQMAA